MLQSLFLLDKHVLHTMPGNCFSSSKETITERHNTRGDESREVNSNNISPIPSSSGPNAGIFAAPQNFTIAKNSQFIDVGGNYVVCNYCSSMKILIMITCSKSIFLKFPLK